MKNQLFCGIVGYDVEIEMTYEQALSCSHSGDCFDDVLLAMEDENILKQLNNYTDEQIRNALKEYGAWDDNDLSDIRMNKIRVIWLGANDIVEEVKTGEYNG